VIQFVALPVLPVTFYQAGLAFHVMRHASVATVESALVQAGSSLRTISVSLVDHDALHALMRTLVSLAEVLINLLRATVVLKGARVVTFRNATDATMDTSLMGQDALFAQQLAKTVYLEYVFVIQGIT
jgi:hypothetical protein